jgi:hypothetical protein
MEKVGKGDVEIKIESFDAIIIVACDESRK